MGQQSHSATNTKLNRIAWLSKQDSKKEFECLMHLFNQESLTECFHELDKDKAVGVDGITKMAYGANLHGNVKQLMIKMKNMAYRPHAFTHNFKLTQSDFYERINLTD